MNPVMFRYTSIIKKLFEKQYEVKQVADFWDVRHVFKGSQYNFKIYIATVWFLSVHGRGFSGRNLLGKLVQQG
jgi:hypothetical protein